MIPEDSIHTANNSQPHEPPLNLPSTIQPLVNGRDVAPQQSPILLVETSHTADIAAQYLPPGWVVATHDGTASTSLGPASHAVIWGRNDEGGRTWAEAVADTLAIPCHIITLSKLPRHWHLGEPLPTGRTPAQLTGYLTAALGRCSVRQPPAAPVPQPAPPMRPLAPIPDVTNLPYIRAGAHGDGAIKPLMKNAVMLIEANPHRWDLRWNAFSARAILGTENLTDQDILLITEWVQLSGVHATSATVSEAINAVAGARRFHPVIEYLDSLTWDGIPRLDMLFIDHAGTPDTELTRAVTGRWFMQAVARIYKPGCQADSTLVLEGIQGLRKSTFFRELFGDRWFTDHLPDITSKDALLQLRGVWCVEIGELATLGRAESAKIKQFLTSRVDRYRDPYGRVVADFPRTCVFAGSINPGAGGYLKDETGARRFWPIKITERINSVNAISDARDHLWAEAVVRYRAGERWYLDTDDLEAAANVVVTERFTTDPWQERIDEFLRGRTETTLAEIFKVALTMPDIGKWAQIDSNRVDRCLAFAQWVREARGSGANRRWVYVPAKGGAAEPLI